MALFRTQIDRSLFFLITDTVQNHLTRVITKSGLTFSQYYFCSLSPYRQRQLLRSQQSLGREVSTVLPSACHCFRMLLIQFPYLFISINRCDSEVISKIILLALNQEESECSARIWMRPTSWHKAYNQRKLLVPAVWTTCIRVK